jgi:uncharacterized protein (DUF433 family)
MGKQMNLFPAPAPRIEPTGRPHVQLVDGVPYIEGSRVPVRRLWDFHQRGTPIATLIARYPTLGPARVLSALSFAYDNRALVEDGAK